jgi:p-cumate 2,3-dioxygenase subunit beta
LDPLGGIDGGGMSGAHNGVPGSAPSSMASSPSSGATAVSAAITRAQVEDFLFEEAALLDAWRLDDWLAMLTEDAVYRVPSNDAPDSVPGQALFMVADDARRIKERVLRLQDRNAHAEFPHSRTRRMVSNVRIVRPGEPGAVANAGVAGHAELQVQANFVGQYRHVLRATPAGLRIAQRVAVLDAHELGDMGLLSFIL